MRSIRLHGKGGRRFRQPPCRRTFGCAPATGTCARLPSAACSARAGKGSGLRVPDIVRPTTRWAVTGAGAIPKDQLPTSMSFAPLLPCGIGFAVRSSKVADPEGSPRLDGLARSMSLRRATIFRAFGHPADPAPKRLTALKTRSTLARGRRLRVRSPGWSMLRGSISCPGGPSFICRSMRKTFWTPDPFRFHPTRSRERDRPFPGVASPYRHAWLPKGTCACRSVVNF